MDTITVDNQTITMEQLEKATNEAEGFVPSQEQPEPEVEKVPVTEPTPEVKEPVVEPVKPQETPLPQKSQSIPDDILKALEETPYKSVPDVVKGYKELQARDTQLSQKVKPFESILDRANRDPQFAEYVRLAEQMYTNPAVAQQYAQPQIQKPDPRQYDMSDPQQIAAYDQALDSYFDLKVDSKLGSKFAHTEMQNKLEGFKNDFRGKFPNITDDLDQILDWAKTEAVKLNPYETSWKLKNWDNREAQITDKVRKELLTKMETAQNATPASTPAPDAEKVSQVDVGRHITRYGMASAEKKFGKDIVFQALRDLTNA